MEENKKLVSVTVPDNFIDHKDTGSIKVGKTYPVIEERSIGFTIKSDATGRDLRCLKELNCGHLQGCGKWILNYE